ncbi:MAG: Phenylalanine-tRNA ligase alpha subunit [Microgenomates group bacterium GW2011_GWA2_46_7]|nr:MAG: Phenylalanine-tRNA ligase alpha subunit [Microgenomates group bacterium GW2011_GWA2_46_7]
MTEALYLVDSYQTTATAKVIAVGDSYLILDQTIFYPQGGGQPSDKGMIKSKTAELNVKSVDYNGGEIKHKGTFKGTFNIDDVVNLEIDWALRLKNMQLHTAGHLVDLIARQVYPALIPIRGMHGIGKKLFIEYEGIQELNIDKINSDLANLITSKPAIKTQFVTLEQLMQMANWLPAKLPSSKKLRILSIGDSYHIPDGGTQLKTGQNIWPITIRLFKHTTNSTLVYYAVTEPVTECYHVLKHGNTADINLPNEITKLESQFSSDLDIVIAQTELDSLYLKYLGKKGLTTELLKGLQNLALQDKKIYGPLLNELKKSQESQIEAKKSKISHQPSTLDLTIPGIVQSTGRLHPTTIIIRELNEFFRYHGFSIAEGPEIEDVEYNFRRLNLPDGHPATDLQDSLFIEEPNLLLRTHTSSIQTRVLSSFKPPLRVVVPGKCYRNETANSTNGAFFYQYQGFVVDKGINIQNLKDMLTQVHQFLFGKDVILRFRYKYYPEVSPGMGVDMQCIFCHGEGCSVCKYRGWIETLGSGITHYNCYKQCGIDPEIYTGYSFGLGLDRLVMSKFGIKDIRKLYGGEIVYL